MKHKLKVSIVLGFIFCTLLIPFQNFTTADAWALRSEVFNWQFYLEIYPDLRNAGLSTVAQAQNHWLNNGINEGRRGSPQFSSKEYLQLYPDVAQAFGSTNYGAAMRHYIGYGLAEKRSGTLKNSRYAMFTALGQATFGNEALLLRSYSKYAAAVSEIWFRGKQLVNNYDTGRLVQTAFSLDGRGECYNPTEGGSAANGAGPSSSVIKLFQLSPGILNTQVLGAYWLKPGTTQYCGATQGASVTSDSLITKNVEVGYNGDPQVIRWLSTINIPVAHKSMRVEALTGYHNQELSTYYQMIPKDLTFEKISIMNFSQPDWSKYNRMYPLIFGTADGNYAVGVFSIDQDGNMAAGRYTKNADYGAFYSFTGSGATNTTKWSVAFDYTNPAAGTYSFETYVIVGSVMEVALRMQAMLKKYPSHFLNLSKTKAAFDVDMYKAKYPDVVAAVGSSEQVLLRHYRDNGMKEKRIASTELVPMNYVQRYPDLSQTFKDDYLGAFKHYWTKGKAEGRNGQ